VKLLLDKDINGNTQGGPYSNALPEVSANGYEAVVMLLRDKVAVT
jgi:hypothetical protein